LRCRDKHGGYRNHDHDQDEDPPEMRSQAAAVVHTDPDSGKGDGDTTQGGWVNATQTQQDKAARDDEPNDARGAQPTDLARGCGCPGEWANELGEEHRRTVGQQTGHSETNEYGVWNRER
jgi:hypothetical protein